MTSSKPIPFFLLFLLLIGMIVVGVCDVDASSRKRARTKSVARVGNFPNSPDFYGFMDEDFSYPNDSDYYMPFIQPGIFHGDEVSDDVEEKKWFGIFKNSNGYYLTESTLIVESVIDEILDSEEGEITGKLVRTIQADSAFYFVEASDLFSPHPIQQANMGTAYIFPDDTIRFDYLGTSYEIFATGNKEKYTGEFEYFRIWDEYDLMDENDWYAVWNYKLYVSATIAGKKRINLLTAHPHFDDQMTNVLFAGDIDGDGILDLIIDNSRHYNAFQPTLYLSKPAADGQVMKPVGSHYSAGC